MSTEIVSFNGSDDTCLVMEDEDGDSCVDSGVGGMEEDLETDMGPDGC